MDTQTEAFFVPLINCGFPEPEHTRTAIRIARHFAAAASYGFAGALPLGAGGAVTTDRDLDQPRPPVTHFVEALGLAAGALAAGAVVPAAALDEIVKPSFPDILYRLAGDLGFRWQAHLHGTRGLGGGALRIALGYRCAAICDGCARLFGRQAAVRSLRPRSCYRAAPLCETCAPLMTLGTRVGTACSPVCDSS